MSEKIKAHHLARRALLYVRQSSAYQVEHNRESRALQYAMRGRLESLGFVDVEVIDEDLGLSANGTAERSGFERMVARVCMGEVGAVAAREVSRFARNSREWQRLVEMCRVVDTLLIDNEMVYSPRQGNDRLLLGLKGSLNEYELDLLRQRSLEARYEKARRGELIVAAPVGFLKTEDQRLEKDPDRRVREAVQLVFTKFATLGSARQTLMWFFDEGVRLPARRPDGELLWKRPNYSAVHRILTNPAYSGAYAYGKSQQVCHYGDGQPRSSSVMRPRNQWLSLIPGAHEGYIGWEQFEKNQDALAENCQGENQAGPPKRGAALLAGLLRCRRCGRKWTVRYTGRDHEALRYCCHRGWLDNGQPRCIAFGGVTIDEAIGMEIMRVVRPGALEAAVVANGQETTRKDEALQALMRDMQAAQYAANRSWKQYNTADPENRLVADELERRWNLALEHVHELQLRIESHQHQTGTDKPPATIEEFRDLAENLQITWNGPDTDVRLKKRIVRTLIKEIVADTDPKAGESTLLIHWQGGVHTELKLPRRRRGQSSQHTSPDIIESVKILARICDDKMIAGVLNRNKLRTGCGNMWTQQRVTSLRCKRSIPCYNSQRRTIEGWMNLTEGARHLGISTGTLRDWVEQGKIEGKHPLPDGPWLFNRKNLDTETARNLVKQTRGKKTDPAVPSSKQKNT